MLSEESLWRQTQRPRQVMMACSMDHLVLWSLEVTTEAAQLRGLDSVEVAKVLAGVREVLAGRMGLAELEEVQEEMLTQYREERRGGSLDDRLKHWQAYVGVTMLCDAVRARAAAGPAGPGKGTPRLVGEEDGATEENAALAMVEMVDNVNTIIDYAYRAGVEASKIVELANRMAEEALEAV